MRINKLLLAIIVSTGIITTTEASQDEIESPFVLRSPSPERQEYIAVKHRIKWYCTRSGSLEKAKIEGEKKLADNLNKINSVLTNIGSPTMSADQVEHYYTTWGASFSAPGTTSGSADFLYLQLCGEAEAVISANSMIKSIDYLKTKKGELESAGFIF